MFLVVTSAVFFVLVVVLLSKGVVIVPQNEVYIVERLGKFHAELNAGLHFVIPVMDTVAYKRSLKEQVIDVPAQTCTTKDNVTVQVDGVIYLQVLDAAKSSYNVENYLQAAVQLAQTTLRSVIGDKDLDELFKARDELNQHVGLALDEASGRWGVKVNRYEIKDIIPPESVKDAMEKQMRAEREKRAAIAQSEGEREAAINEAEGEKQAQIRRAQGQAEAIKAVAEATAEGIAKVAEAIKQPGGFEATQLKIAEKWVDQFGSLAKETNTMILPANVADVASMVNVAMSAIRQGGPSGSRKTPAKQS